jgi:hypothetical protein
MTEPTLRSMFTCVAASMARVLAEISSIIFHFRPSAVRCFFKHPVIEQGRSQWPRGLRHELCSPARTLGSWVRISFEAWMSVYFYSVCVVLCVGSGLAMCRTHVQGVLPTVYRITVKAARAQERPVEPLINEHFSKPQRNDTNGVTCGGWVGQSPFVTVLSSKSLEKTAACQLPIIQLIHKFLEMWGQISMLAAVWKARELIMRQCDNQITPSFLWMRIRRVNGVRLHSSPHAFIICVDIFRQERPTYRQKIACQTCRDLGTTNACIHWKLVSSFCMSGGWSSRTTVTTSGWIFLFLAAVWHCEEDMPVSCDNRSGSLALLKYVLRRVMPAIHGRQ